MKYPFPKVDLHYHLDGSIPTDIAWQLFTTQDIDIDVKDYDELKKKLTVDQSCRDVFEYLATFEHTVKFMQTKENISLITYESIRHCVDLGLCYLEIRFAPQLHLQKGLTQRDAIDAVLEGKKKAEKDFPTIKVGIILCCMIETYDNDADNELTVKLCEEYLGKGVVGIDLAGGEDSVPMDHYAYLFEDYHKKGLPMTIHAGDNGKPQNVSTVIDWGATRVGHGKKCWYDPEVMQKVIDTGTTIEVCLTSNIQCKTEPSYQEHPAKRLLDAGVKVTLNTDNMWISSIDLEYEYDMALERAGFTYNDLVQMNIYSIEASFMPQEDKAA